jgi:hypothetical protein
MALGVTSLGDAVPPERLAFTVPVAICPRNEFPTPLLARERVTVEPDVLETMGELALTVWMPVTGYVEEVYAAI